MADDNKTQEVGAVTAPSDATLPAKPAPPAKDVKGWFKAKEDCYLGGGIGYKTQGDVFYYEGPPHDSLEAVKKPKNDEDE